MLAYPFGVTRILERRMSTSAEIQNLARVGLYDPSNEHDACGVGFVAHIKGQ